MTARVDSGPRRDLVKDDPNLELASDRTSLSFERTRMSSDGSLMSTLRTSLSLIGFGFTIYKVLGNASGVLPRASETARNLGLAMLALGVALLAAGIITHAAFDRQLSTRRRRLYEAGLMHTAPPYRATPTYVAAILLLVIGLSAIASIAFRLAG
jgi:putative membrane protein